MKRNVKIVPAILTDDPAALEKMVRQAKSFTDYVQIDIMDGRFVPSQSIIREQVAGLSIKLRWEAHLMVTHPEEHLEVFQQAGASKIIFHHEATASPTEVISRIKNLGLEAGLAINPETPVSAIVPCINDVDSILLLTVNPGFYGSQFIPEVMDKVTELRNIQPGIEIGVDGGIKESNIKEIASVGVDYICVGSAIFLQADPAESYRRLQSLVQ
ncbi:MAG TPA: ribulose-phosphate 3-epimerase [Dehalococcoidia bacterium]|nr:ribulose-phosphate 3-epimerase [Dehalococcoidia bacterium]